MMGQAICRATGCFCYHGNLIKWWVIDIRWFVYQIEFILRNMEYWWLLGLIINEISIARIDLVSSLRIDYWSLTPIPGYHVWGPLITRIDIHSYRFLLSIMISVTFFLRHNSLSSRTPSLYYRLRFIVHPSLIFYLIMLSNLVCIKHIFIYSIYRYRSA